MKLFRSIFGESAEVLEERGDALRLAGQWREAAWFYGRACRAARAPALRTRLEERAREATHQAFRSMLDEADSLARRRLNREALDVLSEAERFAQGGEDEAMVAARRWSLHDADGPGPAPTAVLTPGHSEDDGMALDGGELGRAFQERLVGRPDSERRRFESLGPDGRRGFVQLGAGDHAAALESFEKENALRPESWVVRELSAQALEGLGRSEEACQQYEAAYRRAPDRSILLLEIARILRDRLARPADALERLETAARRHPPGPESLELHLERVFLRHELGRPDDAIQLLTELMHEPSLDRAFLAFNRGGLHEQVGRIDEAERDLKEAVSLAPDNVLYLERVADLIFRARRNAEEALELLEQALAVDAHDFAGRRGGLGNSPDRARLQFKAARILFVLDRTGEAAGRVEEGLIVSHDPRVHEALLDLRREIRAVERGVNS
ncbi:MAG TPA: tetratricopeptide repeat protein [Candidatus Eisenbacteria bacterium]